jgi:triosephosphate isomerase
MAKNYMIGNWKMNQGLNEIKDYFAGMKEQALPAGNFWIAPQSLHIGKSLTEAEGSGFKIGAQNCSDQDFGAFTGEICTTSLKEIGAHFVILGHSERRAYYNETDTFINAKVKKAMENGLVPVLCCGETLEQREGNQTLDIVLSQIKAGLEGVKLTDASELIIAYEPVWAIGTGKTASPEQAEEVHAAIRNTLKELYGDLGNELSILYGGSVKPANVSDLLAQPNINGGLVGGASLKVADFTQLCKATL